MGGEKRVGDNSVQEEEGQCLWVCVLCWPSCKTKPENEYEDHADIVNLYT